MNTEAPAQVQSDESRGSFLLFAAAGIGIYVALKILDPAIGFPLRRISSVLATFFLNALSVPCTLSGTAISTGNFTFDVNPDCSGSTSLRIMLTLGALWFGMYPNLTLGRRVVCLLLAAPIAVLFNAIRVTVLVVLGDARAEPVEGFPHELVGITSFVFAMGAVYLMTLLMAKEPEVVKRAGPRAHLAVLVLALAVCYAPVLWGSYLFGASPLVGGVHVAFVMISLGLLVVKGWGRTEESTAAGWIPCGLLGLSLLMLIAGTMADVSTLSSISLVGSLIAIVLYLCGPRFAIHSLPLMGVLYLGLSGMHYFVLMALARLVVSEEDRHTAIVLMEITMAAVLIGLFFYLTMKKRRRDLRQGRGALVPLSTRLMAPPMKLMILGVFAGILFQTYFNSEAAAFDKEFVLQVPLELGDWRGVRLQASELEIEAYGESGVLSHVYRKEGWDDVHLLISSSAGRRYTGHNPRDCMANRGWRVLEEETIEFAGKTRRIPMFKLLMGRGDQRIEFRYWIESDQGDLSLTTPELYLTDVGLRMTGRRPNWSVYRVYSRPGSEAIEDFLNELVRLRTDDYVKAEH